MKEDQIKHMVDRFLMWRLPENFNPDGGISFKRGDPRHPMPTGTNLIDATQAEAMVRHMIEGLPLAVAAVHEAVDDKAGLLGLLDRVMRQTEADLTAAHAEICKLQGLDPATHKWPEWSSPANTLRWFESIREKVQKAAAARRAADQAWEDRRDAMFDASEARKGSAE